MGTAVKAEALRVLSDHGEEGRMLARVVPFALLLFRIFRDGADTTKLGQFGSLGLD